MIKNINNKRLEKTIYLARQQAEATTANIFFSNKQLF